MSKEGNNLGIGKLDPLNWAKDKKIDSIEKLYKYVTGLAEEAISWYLKRKDIKKRGALITRWSAIFLTSAAGIIPLISEILFDKINALWGSVAIILAGSFIGFDKFGGFSTGWMRYLTAELKIRNSLQSFKIEWEIRKSPLNGNDPDDRQLKSFLDMCKTFLLTTNTTIENEFDEWKLEFKNALKQIDNAVKAQQEIKSKGAINVTVANGDQCDDGWNMYVNGKDEKKYTGKTAALTNIDSGDITIKVNATIDRKDVTAEKAVTINPSVTSTVEMELA